MSFNLLILFLKTHHTGNLLLDSYRFPATDMATNQKQMAFQIFKCTWVTVDDSPNQVRCLLSAETFARDTGCSDENFLHLIVSFIIYQPSKFFISYSNISLFEPWGLY